MLRGRHLLLPCVRHPRLPDAGCHRDPGNGQGDVRHEAAAGKHPHQGLREHHGELGDGGKED